MICCPDGCQHGLLDRVGNARLVAGSGVPPAGELLVHSGCDPESGPAGANPVQRGRPAGDAARGDALGGREARCRLS
jgi:hypothetical protein